MTAPLVSAAVLVLFAAAPARAVDVSCAAQYSGLCERLAADSRVMLSPYPFIPNPARTGPAVLDFPALRTRVRAGQDAANLGSAIRPTFDALAGVARGWVAAAPLSRDQRTVFSKRLQALAVEVNDRERCRDRSRPFVAGYDGQRVTICPWMTHLSAATMVTVLAHELGHFLDPCWGRGPGEPATYPAVPPLPASRDSDCSGDEEAFADMVGARLVDELLHGGAAARVPPFPTAPDERFAALLFYTLQPQCQVSGNARLTPFFAMPNIRSFLGCTAP